MKRMYAKPWRPPTTFVRITFGTLVLAGVGGWLAVFEKQQVLFFVDTARPFIEKFNDKKQLVANPNTKAGPLSDAITLEKIVELSKLKKEYQ